MKYIQLHFKQLYIHLFSKITLESLKALLRALSIIYSTRNTLLENKFSSFFK